MPVVPLASMFAGRLPGAIAPKIACIMFDSGLIGPQFVSPSTRRPTSISGSDSRIAMIVSQIVEPETHLLHDDERDALSDHADGHPAQREARRVEPAGREVRERALEHVPPQHQRGEAAGDQHAGAGHMTQSRTSLRVKSWREHAVVRAARTAR